MIDLSEKEYLEICSKIFNYISKNELQACNDSYIYVHDQNARLDSLNCSIFNVKKVMTGGFEMGNIHYNDPNTLSVAFDVLGDIIFSSASQQYGGYTVPNIDNLLAPYAEVSEDITPIQKQNFENRFWNLTNGGKIQYVKYPINYNLKAMKTLVRRAMKFHSGRTDNQDGHNQYATNYNKIMVCKEN